MRIKPVGKIVILIIVFGALFGAYRMWKNGSFGGSPGGPSGVGSVVPTIDYPGMSNDVAFPSGKTEVRMLVWAWNAQMGLMFANGGVQTTKGSLMAQHQVNLKFIRQDDSSKMQEALVAFATDLSRGNPDSDKGAQFVAIMGDGSATFLKGVNDTLRKLGSEYMAKVVGSSGYSRGEDKLMGPASWKESPLNCRGGLVAGVLRDGDWNIAQKWLADNSLKTNPDEKTWDPDAMNWVNASDYIDAAQKYVAGYSEDRPVVRNGRRTGDTKHVTVNGVVTWTPGDVIVAEKKGGLVGIVSTKEYSSQMPQVIIGIDKWMTSNRATVEGMLQAMVEGGDKVKNDAQALKKGADVSNEVYQEKDTNASYWEKYYKGAEEKDKTGVTVSLGGSSVNNLADNLLTFGLAQGSDNLFAATYSVFGNIVVAQYPSLVPSIMPVSEILDTSYLKDIAKQGSPTAEAIHNSAPNVGSMQEGNVVGRRAYNIQFETGRANFSQGAFAELNKLRQQLLVASGTFVEIHGHTDNQGNPQANMNLSEARAFAVKAWLHDQSSLNFPTERIKVFAHGQQNPIAPNSTGQGRAQNRRVEIVLVSAK